MPDLTPATVARTPGGYIVQGNLMRLLTAVTARCAAHPLMTAHAIPALPHWSADLYNHLKRLVQKQLSLLVVVRLEPSGVGQARACHACLRETRISVRVLENVFLNQSASGLKIPALALAESLACGASEDGLQGWDCPPATGLQGSTLWLDETGSLGEDTDPDNEAPGGVVSWRLSLSTAVKLTPAS